MNDRTGGQLAVITGASSGIGYELAKEFARHSFDLLIISDSARIEEAAANLPKMGGQVEAMQADLAEYDGVEQVYERILSMARPVDSLVLDAGVGVSGEFARGTALDAELNLIRLNVISPVHLAKRVLPDMLKRGNGRIL